MSTPVWYTYVKVMIDIALDAAKRAGDLAYRYFKAHSASLRISYKADNSPVTRTDIEAEKLIRKIISQKFPDHGIVGEELPPVNLKSKYQWIIDPIDGTRDFTRGIPSWGIFLALTKDQKPEIGVYFSPPFDELFVAQKGKGAYLNGKKTKVSKVSELTKACLSHGAITHFKKAGKLDGFLKLSDKIDHKRGFGTYSLNLLLKGQIEIDIDTAGGIYDVAAPSILVEEAGGKFSDFAGNWSLTSGSMVLTNGHVHNQVLKLLNS